MKNKYKDLEIKFRKKLNGDFLGSFQSFFKGLGVEFDSLREYTYGDNIKNIDWKATAKSGEVFIKNFEEERDIKVLFVIKDFENINFGSEKITKKELLENIFFILAKSSVLSGFSVGVKIGNQFLDFKKSEINLIKTIKILENSLSTEGFSPLQNMGLNIKKHNLKNTLIFILGENTNPNLAELKYLNSKNEIFYLNIFDYFEENLSEENFEINLKNNFITNFFTGNKEKVEEFRKNMQEKFKNLSKNLKKYNIEYLRLNTQNDIFLELSKFFGKI